MGKEKMLIQLDKDFRMTSVPRNLVLEQRSEVKDKENEEVIREIWVNAGYHPTLKSLLVGYKRKSILLSSAKSLEELQVDIDKIRENIDKFTEGGVKFE